MVDNILISVIVTVNNVASYLVDCIESIINQTYTNIEIILVDDGSEDDSGKICDSYVQIDNRIRVIHKENGGLVSARKEGLGVTEGDYIIFVDGRDWIKIDMLQAFLEKALSVNADIVDAAYFYIKDRKEVVFPMKEADYQLCMNQTKLIIENWLSDSAHILVSAHIYGKLYRANVIKKSYAEVPEGMRTGEEIISYIALFKYVDKISVFSFPYYHHNHQELLFPRVTSIDNLRKLNELLGFCTRKIENEYPYINKNKLNIWYLCKVVCQFRQLGLGKEWDAPIYKCKNIEALQNCRLIIYGAGNVGKDIYAQLSKYESCNIVGWVDKNYQKYAYPYCKVKSPDEINILEYDVLIIAVLRKKLADSIRQELVDKGVIEEKIIWLPVVKLTDDIKPVKLGYNIIKFTGGLGNQMFQYAFYRAMQERGIKVKVNIMDFRICNRDFELPDIFPKVQIDLDNKNEFDIYKDSLSCHELYHEKGDGVYDAALFNRLDTSFIGYWQTEKYFYGIANKIREEFTFNVDNSSLIEIAEEISKAKNSVSLHVRRGDYLQDPERYCGICTIDYYMKAVHYVNERTDSACFFVFSDDLQWARDNLDIANAVYVDKSMFKLYKNWFDMYLMTCCKHNIIANSSFSWWGAWLNSNKDKIVVAPKRWLNGETTLDIWPNGWIKL